MWGASRITTVCHKQLQKIQSGKGDKHHLSKKNYLVVRRAVDTNFEFKTVFERKRLRLICMLRDQNGLTKY